MKRFVRCFVMWLLVLALPVQGFAAATMLLCGAGHHGTVQATEGGHDHAGHMHMGAQDVSAVSESVAHEHAAGASPPHEDSAFSPFTAKHAKVMGKCSACAACCTVAFLPTNVIAFTYDDAHEDADKAHADAKVEHGKAMKKKSKEHHASAAAAHKKAAASHSKAAEEHGKAAVAVPDAPAK